MLGVKRNTQGRKALEGAPPSKAHLREVQRGNEGPCKLWLVCKVTIFSSLKGRLEDPVSRPSKRALFPLKLLWLCFAPVALGYPEPVHSDSGPSLWLAVAG